MLKAALVLKNGLLESCGISGHAGAGPKGADIVCAAVTVLARTAYSTLSGRNGIAVQGDFPERGEFFLEVTGIDPENTEFVSGITNFLCEGLSSVSDEFPDHCMVRIERL